MTIKKLNIILFGFLLLQGNMPVFAETDTSKAASSSDPRASVEEAYRQEMKADNSSSLESPHLEKFFSRAMVKFVKIDDCVKRDTGEVGVLDFDPFLNGQDGEVKGLKTQVVKRDEDRATVEATFHSLGQKQSILFDMILEGNAWRINDIRSLDEKKQRTSLYAALAEAYPDKSTACAKKHSKE